MESQHRHASCLIVYEASVERKEMEYAELQVHLLL